MTQEYSHGEGASDDDQQRREIQLQEDPVLHEWLVTT